jgi:hypothetical protein
VVDLLIVGVVCAIPVLYAADRIIKARAQARRLRTMSDRLDAATARAEEQQEKRQEAAKFSAALTSVMPAINRPPLSLPNAPSPAGPHSTGPHSTTRPRSGCAHTGPQDHAHRRRPSHTTGEHAVRSADRAIGR